MGLIPSSTLDRLDVDSTHNPMTTSIFLFSYKKVSRTSQTHYFNIIRYGFRCMIFSWMSSTGSSGTLLNVYVPVCIKFPMTVTSNWGFDRISGNGSNFTLWMSCFSSFWSFWFITTNSSFYSPWMCSSWPSPHAGISFPLSLVVKHGCPSERLSTPYFP